MDSNTGVSYGYCKISKNSFLIQHLLWLLLTVLPRQSKASWGACSLILRLPCNFDFDQKLSRNVAQIILYYHVTNQFFVAWFYWSHAFDFRICFGKILIVFHFDEKLTQSVALVAMQYHVSKDFLPLHLLRLVRCFQFRKTEHGGENPDFDFVPVYHSFWVLSLL